MSSIVSDHFILLPPRGTIVEGLLGTRALKSFMLRLNDAQKADRGASIYANPRGLVFPITGSFFR